MKDLKIIGREAEAASKELARLGITERNNALNKVADALIKSADYIKEANETDIVNGRKNGMSTALLDRLLLSDARIEGMADGLRVLAGLDDPIGEVKSMKTRPNGLMIGKKTVPLGVVAIIYESRPNVTADAFGLCFKSANACILRGGSDSVNSNIAIVNVITDVLKKEGINPAVISYITDTDRKYVDELMHMNEYVDVIIPRGGAGLIKNVVNKPGTDVSPLAKVVILLLFALPTAFISFLIISSAFDLSNFSTSEIIFLFFSALFKPFKDDILNISSACSDFDIIFCKSPPFLSMYLQKFSILSFVSILLYRELISEFVRT